MSLPTKALSDIVRRSTAHFRTSFPGFPLGIKKFLGRSARAQARLIWGLHKAVEDVDQNIVPSSKSSTDVLSEWAALLGLPDGAGGYGRFQPTTASGGAATLTGVGGTAYADALQATAEDGTTIVKLSGAVTIPGAGGLGSIAAIFVAVTKGTVGNLPVGTVCTWSSAPAGADPTFTLTSELSKALDTEDNPSVYARIVQRLQNPPRGGVAQDFREWSELVAGIIGVWVYPKRSGSGTVDVVPTTGGTGQSRVPSDALIAEGATLLEEFRVPGAEAVYVIKPYAPNGAGHLVKIRVTPSQTKYAFDWTDTAAAYTVDAGGYAAGPPATLRLNTLAPASLKAAIDAYIADTSTNPPRLQVLSTGVVINTPIAAVAWSDGGGKTTLTLETVPSTWTAPSNGDTVLAYGPVVATIAAGVKALVDALGPSKISGFADPFSVWQDSITISGLTAVAEIAIDTDGTKLIERVPPGDVTIDGAGADVRGGDSTGAPELLYLLHVGISLA